MRVRELINIVIDLHNNIICVKNYNIMNPVGVEKLAVSRSFSGQSYRAGSTSGHILCMIVS